MSGTLRPPGASSGPRPPPGGPSSSKVPAPTPQLSTMSSTVTMNNAPAAPTWTMPSFFPPLLNNKLDFLNKPRRLFSFKTFRWTDSTTLSNVCGHLSFVVIGMSYLQTDILPLRCTAMGALTLTCMFQYYRPVPMMLPLRWNLLFLAINCGMVASLLMESDEADRLSPELLELHEKEFKQFGFNRVEFKRLLSQAEKVELPVDTLLTREGKRAKHIYYKTGFGKTGESSVMVTKNGKHICDIDNNQFIGETSLLTFFHDDHLHLSSANCVVKDKVARKAEREAENNGDEDYEPPKPDEGKTYTFFRWDIRELTAYLRQPENRMVRTALMAHLCENMRDKLMITTEKISRRDTRVRKAREALKSENPERIYAPELRVLGSNGGRRAAPLPTAETLTHKESLSQHASHGNMYSKHGFDHDREAERRLLEKKAAAAAAVTSSLSTSDQTALQQN